MPKRRTRHHRGRVRHFPRDDASKPVHMTAFIGFKAGMTHVVKYQERREGKKVIKKDVIHAATVVETPPVKVVGCVGYIETPRGLRALQTVFAQHLDNEVKRRFYKNWINSKKKAFSKYQDKYKVDAKDGRSVQRDLERIRKYASVVRVIVASQTKKLNFRQQKAHVIEVQVNGGSIKQKVDWCFSKFEQEVTVGEVFSKDECVDTIGITKGKGTQGVIQRYGCKKLRRKTHRGLRKVGCIGAWHPAAVKWTVARRGQQGYHSRTEINKKIYRIGAGNDPNNAMCDQDAIEKSITPMGGFPHYGEVRNDWLLIKGQVLGVKKRVVILRKSIFPTTANWQKENIELKFIDTASKIGHGRFQTFEEKEKIMGPRKAE
jgi:large subunit ribosomal protein L3e